MDEENVIPEDNQEEIIQEEDTSTSQEENLEQEDVVAAPAEDAPNDQDEELEDNSELSPRQQKRLEQVEKKAEELKLNKILDRIQQGKRPASKREEVEAMDYRQTIDAPDEVYNSLSKDREQYGERRYSEGLEQAKAIEFRTNLKLDLPLVKDKLDRLDAVDAELLDREYLKLVGFDPKTGFVVNSEIGYADYIEARVEQAERLAARLNVQSQKNIAKQAAQTGIRPDGGAHKGLQIKNPGDIASMSADDFEKNRATIYKQAGLSYKP